MALLLMLQLSWHNLLRWLPFHPIFFFALLLYLTISIKNRKSQNPRLKFPPSSPKLPIIGNLHQLGKFPHRSLRAVAQKYGPLLLLHLGHSPTLVVSSPEIAKEIMKTNDIVFSNRPKTTAEDILYYGCIDIGFAPYGEYWRQARKLCVLELLSLKRVESFQYVREEEVAVLVNKIRKARLEGPCVNLSEMLATTSNNVVSRCIIGRKCEEKQGKSRFAELSRRVMEQLVAFSLGDHFPYLGFVDFFTGLIPSLKATFCELDSYLNRVIEEHEAVMNNRDVHRQSFKKDFVEIILQFQQSGKLDFELTEENLKAFLMDLLVGGTDTTSTLVEWTMAELVKNPKTMKKAQEEVRKLVGKKLKINMNDMNQMGFLKCVIKETLRLHPPFPLLIHRESSVGTKLRGYDILPKTKVIINAWAIQIDPRIWEKPEEFIPERFEKMNIDFNSQDFRFITFGGGRRGCPGSAFALAAVEYMIANVLYWFDWRVPDGAPGTALMDHKELDMSEANGLTVHNKIPLLLVPLPYSWIHHLRN